MADKTGVARLRQAIVNQVSAGEGEFHLTFDDASKLVTEINAELLEICNSAEREIGRYVWMHGVPAPKDADGKVVPLNTEKLYTDKSEMVFVDSICYGGRLWHVRGMHGDKTYWLDSLHLHRPDSWERLEEDVKKSECEYFDHKDEPCLGCPAKKSPDCIDEFAKDVIRRAKALAERDAKALTPQSSPHEAKEATDD